MKGFFYSLVWTVIISVLILGGVWGQDCPYDAPIEASNGCIENQNFPQARVIGRDKEIVDNDLYPYIVSLQILISGNHALGSACYEHFCGGTMISPNLILTAAHCFDKLKSQYPEQKLNGQLYYEPTEAIYAAVSPQCRHLSNEKYGRMETYQIFIHPEYKNEKVPKNDVAILQVYRLEGKYYEGPLVQVLNGTAADVEEVQLLGYGEAQPGDVGKYIVYPLHSAKLKLLDENICKYFLDQEDNVSSAQLNYSNMVCYQNDRADTCQGDSGGPLLDYSTGFQVALVSWGPGSQCSDVGRLQPPGVYVRLTLFVDWIQKIVQEFGDASTPQNIVDPTPTPKPALAPTLQPVPIPTPSPTPAPIATSPTPTPTPVVGSVWIQSHYQLKVGMVEFLSDFFPQFVSFTETGDCAPSFECDIISTICKILKQSCIIVPLGDLDAPFKAIERGDVDLTISSISVNPQRAEQVHFVRPYYYYSGAQIFVLDTVSKSEHPSWEDLKGKNVCVNENFYAIPGLQFYGVNFVTVGIKASFVLEGTCDYVVSESTHSIDGMVASSNALVKFGAPYGIAVAQQARDGLGAEISDALVTLMNKGENSQLLAFEEKYLVSSGYKQSKKLFDLVTAITATGAALPAYMEDVIWDEPI